MADAVVGAKQYGAKTTEILRTAEFKHAFKNSQEQKSEVKHEEKSRDKGYTTAVEKISTVKKEQAKLNAKQIEQQKAIKIWENYYKKSWTG